MTASPPKSIFITCQGTRGDIQPYCHLGVALAERGWRVLFGAPAEFSSFITKFGLEFTDLGPAPTHAQYEEAAADEAQRSRFSRPWAAYKAAQRLYDPPDGPPFTLPWFKAIAAATEAMRPDVLLLVFTAWCGAAAIPALLGLPTRVVLSYPMPLAPSAEFGVSMAGTGFSARWGWVNRLQWRLSERWIVGRIHVHAARRNLQQLIADAADAPLPGSATTQLDESLNTAGLPAIFAFSPALLPKPADWPANYHVVRHLGRRRSVVDPHRPLPPGLQAYLDAYRKRGRHVIYIGFGSLGFFPPARVTAILDAAAAAVTKLAASHPVAAVIQTTLSSTPGKTGTMTNATNGTAIADDHPPFYTFSDSVDHAALFPQTSLVVSHGGIGTVATALGAGKPVLSVCCLPTADQSFWADLCRHRGLGPQWFWVDDLTPQRLADGILDGLKNYERYTRAAEALAREMARDDAAEAAAAVLDAEAEEARKVVVRKKTTANAFVTLGGGGAVKGA
jgi:sterol 3beta-glucosyltransferase